MDTQIKHAKIQLRNYYHMEINKNKEGEINGKSKNSKNN